VVRVFEMHLHCVADPHANEGPGNGTIESPETEPCFAVEIGFDLLCLKVDPDGSWLAPRNRRRDISRIFGDVSPAGMCGVYRVDAVAETARMVVMAAMANI